MLLARVTGLASDELMIQLFSDVHVKHMEYISIHIRFLILLQLVLFFCMFLHE